MLRFCWLFCFFLTLSCVWATDGLVYLKDKGHNLLRPITQYLSPQALDRRNINHVHVDYSDYGVEELYLQQLVKAGYSVKGSSKWLNAVYISDISTVQIANIKNFIFVERLTLLKEVRSIKSQKTEITNRYPCESFALPQRDMIQANQLHTNGFIGRGVIICVMDDGFNRVNQIEAFKHLFDTKRILGAKNFLTGDSDIYFVGGHGTSVLSNIAAYIPGKIHGTGYGASFLLARTEIDSIETPLEMFQWAQAAEWADSSGAHIISTSLGYSQFDNAADDYYYADMDGRTTIISKAASIAVSKGMLVVNSAGNEGGKLWRHIVAPADVEGVVTVGAVDSREQIADFSSRGPTWDGRTKPDLSCQGVSNVSVGVDGNIYYPSGTSFSCPTFSGLAACLMQAAPNEQVEKLKTYIYGGCSKASITDNDYGRGIPRGADIYRMITGDVLQPLSDCDFLNSDGVYIYPVPAQDEFFIMFDNRKSSNRLNIQLFDVTGKNVTNLDYSTQQGLQQIRLSRSNLNILSGLYYLQLSDENGRMLTEQKVILY